MVYFLFICTNRALCTLSIFFFLICLEYMYTKHKFSLLNDSHQNYICHVFITRMSHMCIIIAVWLIPLSVATCPSSQMTCNKKKKMSGYKRKDGALMSIHFYAFILWRRTCLTKMYIMGCYTKASFILFLLICARTCHSDQFRCNICTCYYTPPTTFMDCSGTGLTVLPLIDEMVAQTLNIVFLNRNNISILDEHILDTWDLLEYMDVRANPMICPELYKVGHGIQVISDCQLSTICKYTYLYWTLV